MASGITLRIFLWDILNPLCDKTQPAIDEFKGGFTPAYLARGEVFRNVREGVRKQTLLFRTERITFQTVYQIVRE